MKNIRIIALILILCLLLVLPTAFASENQTSIAIADEGDSVLSNDYYFNASVENDTGNGSIDNPYKYFNASKIQSNSVIHMADGVYELDTDMRIDNVKIIGQHVNETIIMYPGVGFKVSNSLTLQNVTLVNLAISDLNNAIINANNVIFSNSFSSSISASKNTQINLYNCTFINNMGTYGGAINIETGNLTVENTLFIDNHATSYGGAIAGQGSSTIITVKKSKFINDHSLHNAGGAIYIVDCLKFYCQDTEFISCSSTFGGAVTSLRSTSTFINVTARDNRAKYDGGAIYSMYLSMSIINSTFDNNSAKNAGAVYADGMGTFEIHNTTFENNRATHTAGAVYSLMNNFTSSNLSFSNNSAGIENDLFESESVKIIIESNNFTLIKYNSTFDGTLPSKYDLRDDYLVTPVKDQGSNGNCWAFASIASLESCILKATGNVYDLSESNMKNLMALFSDYGWYMFPNNGGYDKMGYGYLVGWLGPINESDDEYHIGTVLSPVLDSMFHVQNVLFLNRDSYTDNDEIKRAILEYGAVSTSIYWNGASNGNHYYNGNKGANHAVTIVGWDDNYSRNNFWIRPPGDGAWIIKNSWGTDRGDKGYYHVSYYDTVCAKPGALEKNFVFVFNDSIKYDKNYQYDIAGKTDYLYNTVSSVWYRNLFEATDDEYLTAVSTYFEKQTRWELSIFVNGDLIHTQEGMSPNSYSTIELSKYIPLEVGDVFEVRFHISVDGDAGVPISEAVSLTKEHYSKGTSFISYDGKIWSDLYNYPWTYPGHTYESQVACIKAFTILNPVRTSINLTVEDPNNPALIKAVVMNEYGNPVLYGNVTLNIEGENHTVEIINGVASIYHLFKNFGDVQISAVFEKVGFIGSSAQINETISKGNVEIGLDIAVDLLDVEINVDLSKPLNETVYVKVNQDVYEVSVNDGKGKLNLYDLYYGEYDVEAFILADYYNCANVTDSFNINYLKVFINTTDVEKYYGDSFTYSVKLFDKHNETIKGKTVRFIIGDDIKEAVTDDNGIASVVLKLMPGSYVIRIVSTEEGKYCKSETSKSISIYSSIELPSSTVYTYNSTYCAYLLDSNGNKLNNSQVIIKIGSDSYNVTTDADGKLNHVLYLNPGSYDITVYNLNNGEVKSQKINVVKRITQNNALTMYYDAGKYYRIKVLDDNGNVAKGVKVTFTVNNKKYTRTTDSQGYASVKISLKPGKYTITAEYKGYKVSNLITIKSTIITKDKSVKKGKTIQFTAKLLDKNGKILKNKKITFKFKGKTYKVKTNKKGIATLKITKKYKVGKYTISTKYGSLTIKNKIRIKK